MLSIEILFFYQKKRKKERERKKGALAYLAISLKADYEQSTTKKIKIKSRNITS